MSRESWSLAVALCVLAGCTGQPEGVPDTTVEGLEPSLAPEQELLAQFRAAQGQSEERDREFWGQVQEGIAACMAEAGFEYVPLPWPALSEEEYAYGDDPGWNPEYVAAYGYGISVEAPVPEYPPDPNEEYVASLSAEGQAAYTEALGVQGEVSDTATDCRNTVARAVGENMPWPEPPALVAQVESEISALWPVRFPDDPRFPAAVEALSECIVAAGGDPVTMENPSAYPQVSDAYQVLLAEGGDLDPDRLARFQAWEIALATADHRCSQGLLTAISALDQEITVEVVSRYRTELEALALQMPTPSPGG